MKFDFSFRSLGILKSLDESSIARKVCLGLLRTQHHLLNPDQERPDLLMLTTIPLGL